MRLQLRGENTGREGREKPPAQTDRQTDSAESRRSPSLPPELGGLPPPMLLAGGGSGRIRTSTAGSSFPARHPASAGANRAVAGQRRALCSAVPPRALHTPNHPPINTPCCAVGTGTRPGPRAAAAQTSGGQGTPAVRPSRARAHPRPGVRGDTCNSAPRPGARTEGQDRCSWHRRAGCTSCPY